MELGGGYQMPRSFSTNENGHAEFSFSAVHLSLGGVYGWRFSERLEFAIGAGFVWSRYEMRANAAISDSLVNRSGASRTTYSFNWFPFPSGGSTRYDRPIDPPICAFRAEYRISQKRANSCWLGLAIGVMPQYTSMITRHVSVYASTDQTYVLMDAGLGHGGQLNPWAGAQFRVERSLANMNRIQFGIDAIVSILPFYTTQLLMNQRDGTFTIYSHNNRFAWLRLSVGHSFTWGSPRKPRWLRLHEERRVSTAP